MKLDRDLKEFIGLLNSKNVRYVVVGGHAVAYHGYPRFTGDIDFFVEASVQNATALLNVLKEFGFADLKISQDDLTKPEQVIQLGRPPHRIDLLTSLSGVRFEEAWKSKIETRLDDLPVYFISKDLLIRNKKATNRPQDQADLDKIS